MLFVRDYFPSLAFTINELHSLALVVCDEDTLLSLLSVFSD